MDSICRICMNNTDDEHSTYIFKMEDNIATALFLISGVKIMELDCCNLPKIICNTCLDKLINAIEFRYMCINSDKHFRKLSFDEEEKSWSKKLLAYQREAFEEEIESFPVQIKCEPLLGPEIPSTSTILQEYEKLQFNVNKPSKQTSQKLFVKEKKAQKKAEKIPCKICNKLFSRGAMWNHKKKFHQDTKLELACHHCNQNFGAYNTLEIHISKQHDIQANHICDLCGKIYPSRSKIKYHLKNYHMYYERNTKVKQHKAKLEGNLVKYPCSICGKFFANIHCLQKHEQTHIKFTTKDYFYCDLCGNKFKSKGEVGTHIKYHHIVKRRYPCALCTGRSFLSNSLLQAHIKVDHYNIKEFKCEFCGKEFGYKQKLTLHRRIHTGETPYSCRYCDQKFRDNTDCRRHEWKHTGYKGNIQCPNCSERFMRNNELQSHLSRCYQRNVQYKY